MKNEIELDNIINNFSSGPRFRQRVRRCFMNGKPCIFCNQENLNSYDNSSVEQSDCRTINSSIFVIMPFRPNLDTFYEWSLKQYLTEGLGIDESKIRRADEFRNIGYVMCEKICRRIQEASLVVVDLSLDNPNVFYELGLAIGLNKPLLVVCDDKKQKMKSETFWHSLGIDIKGQKSLDKIIVNYPNVGYLDGTNQKIGNMVTRVKLEPLNPGMNIAPLLVPAELPDVNQDDIDVSFESSIKAALGVAINNLKKSNYNLAGVNEALEDLSEQVRTLWEDQTSDPFIFKKDETYSAKSFEEISSKINTAFACIVDLAGEKPHSYFWLGYCHSRGVNVIPIFRPVKSDSKNEEVDREDDSQSKHVLAFDIRALWYIDFRENSTHKLALLLQGVLEELIARDVPKRERNIFWERLTREMRVNVFTGAVHHEELNREVVGDWDLRTVSELVHFLSSADESVIPELEKPIYALETIRLKQKEKWDVDSLKAYLMNMEQQLADKSCLIIASPDVNPLTEVALAKMFGVYNLCYQGNSDKRDYYNDRLVIALKEKSPDGSSNEVESMKEESIAPFFTRSHKDVSQGYRGFLVGSSKIIQEKYRSQDEAESKDYEQFYVLAHLVVMKNPFSKKIKDTIIVLLNGVSGPGTFGLAEILTGGANEHKALSSEILLKEINQLWASEVVKDNFKGIEAIIKVKIKPDIEEMDSVFSDVRTVTDWEKWLPDDGEDNITNDNPRAILT